MARTDAGALLTAQHRRAQLQLRAAALRDFTAIWPLWQGDDTTFGRLVEAAFPLVHSHHQLSAAVAAAYYQSLRAAERVGGTTPTRLAAVPDPAVIAGTLYLTGLEMTRRALAAGQAAAAARQTALVRASGTVTRLTMAGGRDTLTTTTREDQHANGYRRVLSGHACEFCRTLAAEPPTSVEFKAHDHCGCVAEPVFT